MKDTVKLALATLLCLCITSCSKPDTNIALTDFNLRLSLISEESLALEELLEISSLAIGISEKELQESTAWYSYEDAYQTNTYVLGYPVTITMNIDRKRVVDVSYLFETIDPVQAVSLWGISNYCPADYETTYSHLVRVNNTYETAYLEKEDVIDMIADGVVDGEIFSYFLHTYYSDYYNNIARVTYHYYYTPMPEINYTSMLSSVTIRRLAE